MSPRSIRRAQERKARKEEARKVRAEEARRAKENAICDADSQSAGPLGAVSTIVSTPIPVSPMSPARLSANRANAQLSTGPTSAAGKAKVCLNALKTGLTGRAVLLPSDDPEHYQALLRDFENQYQPATIREQQLVETICATFWRICRIPTLEAALFAKGRREFVEAFPDEEDLSRRALLIDGEILIKYEKQIRNLGVQDARLHRQYQKLSAELLKIRQERLEREEQQQVESVPSSDLGFEFSTHEIRELVETLPDATDPVSLPAAGPGENQMEAQAA